jgi:hypothetical protein
LLTGLCSFPDRLATRASGFGIDEPLDLHDYACLRPILTAMIRVENGRQSFSWRRCDRPAAAAKPG